MKTHNEDRMLVVNLSSVKLTSDQIALLGKGLSFTPTPKFDSFTWVKDAHLFARKLALHKFHKSNIESVRQFETRETEAVAILEALQEESKTGVFSISAPFSALRPKSRFTPSISQYTNIDMFLSMVSQELRKLEKRGQPCMSLNLLPLEKKALEQLCQNENIVIKPADKGGNIMIMDTGEYIDMVLRLLGDESTYEILESNPTEGYL